MGCSGCVLYDWLFDKYKSFYAIIHNIRCRCGMKENIPNFSLSPLCLICMKFFMPSVIKLGCKRFMVGNGK